MKRPLSGWRRNQRAKARAIPGCVTICPSCSNCPARLRTMLLSRERPSGAGKRKNSGWSPGFMTKSSLPEQLRTNVAEGSGHVLTDPVVHFAGPQVQEPTGGELDRLIDRGLAPVPEHTRGRVCGVEGGFVRAPRLLRQLANERLVRCIELQSLEGEPALVVPTHGDAREVGDVSQGVVDQTPGVPGAVAGQVVQLFYAHQVGALILAAPGAGLPVGNQDVPYLLGGPAGRMGTRDVVRVCPSIGADQHDREKKQRACFERSHPGLVHSIHSRFTRARRSSSLPDPWLYGGSVANLPQVVRFVSLSR